MSPFQDSLQNSLVLAPLTKGGNLPFRRLCADFGAPVTFSEMAYARFVVKGEGRELALLRRHPSEKSFGVQLAARGIDEGVTAAKVAIDRGADFIDINCGCPIHDTVRRGLGAQMLCRPAALGKFIAGLVQALPVPVTVKVRTGWSDDEINVLEVTRILEESGAAAVTVHGRTKEQRYTKKADWALVGEVVKSRKIPIIGNGDILTHFEARDKKQISNCAGLMLGRGALIKPWIFSEIQSGQDFLPSAEERVGFYWKLATFMKEHFRDDEKGFGRAMFFLPWHFSFFCRYRPLTEKEWGEPSKTQPLLQTRFADNENLSPLDRLLRCENEEVHKQIAVALWKSNSVESAVEALGAMAELPAVLTPPVPDRLDYGEYQG